MFFYLNFSFFCFYLKGFCDDIYIYLIIHIKKNGCSRIYTYFPSLFFYIVPHFPLVIIELPYSTDDYDLIIFSSDKWLFHLINLPRNRKSFFFFYFLFLFRFITSDFTHIFLIHLLSVALFFSSLLVIRKILRLSFHSFVFNRKYRWLYGFLPC